MMAAGRGDEGTYSVVEVDGNEPIRITLATTADAALVHRLMWQAFGEYDGVLEPPTGALAESVADVEAAIAAGGAVLVWQGDVAVASARFQPEADHLYVGRVSVPPAYRGKGLARAVMTFLEEYGRRLGLPEARVGVRRNLPGNIALYERLGYVIVREEPHPRGPAYTSVTMAKRL
jgi:ribosomal protein S18 acetylase RimI-like enzyme